MSKIVRLETLCLSRMHEPERQWITARQRIVKADCAIVVIHTDEGLVGIGEASAYGWPLQIREMKFRIGTEWSWDGVTVDRFLGLVRELVQAVDGRMELMLDGNCRLTEEQALPIAQEMDRLGCTWFEEPIPRDQIEGYVRLNAAVDMPITGGESFHTLEQLKPYLEQRAYRIAQPDAAMCGITAPF